MESDFVKAVEAFLSSLDDECFQPGEKRDRARENLINQLKLEKEKAAHHLNAHTYPQYNCQACSVLLSRLKSMLNNLPGLKGIHNEYGHMGNRYVDYGYQEAINRVIKIVTDPNYDRENFFASSTKSPFSETLNSETLTHD